MPIFFWLLKKILLMGNDVKLSKPQTITLMECNFANFFVVFCFVFADNGLLIFRTYQILFPTFLLTTSLKNFFKRCSKWKISRLLNQKWPHCAKYFTICVQYIHLELIYIGGIITKHYQKYFFFLFKFLKNGEIVIFYSRFILSFF